MMGLYELVLWATGLAVLNGLVVYLVLYKMLGHKYGDKLRSPSRLKEEIVMCGLEYEEDTLSPPVSRVFADIIKRSLPRLSEIIEKGGGSEILNNWFTWMLIILFVVILLAYLLG